VTWGESGYFVTVVRRQASWGGESVQGRDKKRSERYNFTSTIMLSQNNGWHARRFKLLQIGLRNRRTRRERENANAFLILSARRTGGTGFPACGTSLHEPYAPTAQQ
jgi:hypothetical protein